MGRKMSADPQENETMEKRIRHFYRFYMATIKDTGHKKRKRMGHDKKINKSRNKKGQCGLDIKKH